MLRLSLQRCNQRRWKNRKAKRNAEGNSNSRRTNPKTRLRRRRAVRSRKNNRTVRESTRRRRADESNPSRSQQQYNSRNMPTERNPNNRSNGNIRRRSQKRGKESNRTFSPSNEVKMRYLICIIATAIALNSAAQTKYRPEKIPDFDTAVEWPQEGLTCVRPGEPTSWWAITPHDFNYKLHFKNQNTIQSLYIQQTPENPTLYIHTQNRPSIHGEVFWMPNTVAAIIWAVWKNENCTLVICYDTRTEWASVTSFINCNQ